MTLVLLAVAMLVAALVVLGPMGGLSVRRYSANHVAAQLAIAGRRLYFSRTPDGAWWRLRLRPCRRVYEDRSGWGEPPPTSASASRGDHSDQVRARSSSSGLRTASSPGACSRSSSPGRPGVGKTSVLSALVDALTDDDVPHAAIELETLAWTHPALSDELWHQHVKTTCALYREAEHRLLLVAETLETDIDADRLREILGADESFLVRLEAHPATLVERLLEREHASWSGLADLVEHTQDLAVTMPALSGVDLVLSTERQRPEAVADRIRVALSSHPVASAPSRR